MIPISAKPILQFKPSHFHNRVLSDYTESRDVTTGEFLRIPYLFSLYSAYELRDAIIDAFSKHSTYCISDDDECIDWERLILFLKKSEQPFTGRNLYNKVLSAYVSRSGWLASFRAIRFAISLIEGKHEMVLCTDKHLIKIIFGRLNKGLYTDPYCRHQKVKEVGRLMALEGMFSVLPEIKPLLQAMLNCLFNYIDILEHKANPQVEYSSDDFVQVERALKVILKQKQFDTSFLPFIEKMTFLHKGVVKKMRHADSNLGSEKLDPWSSVKNQATLDESVRLLRKAVIDNAVNGEARRLKMEKDFAERP